MRANEYDECEDFFLYNIKFFCWLPSVFPNEGFDVVDVSNEQNRYALDVCENELGVCWECVDESCR